MTSLNIFTKCPYTGNPKSRMQSFLTDKERTFISKYMLLNILQEVTKLNGISINLWVYPKYKHPFFQEIQSKYKINLVEQIGNSLNHRMQNCIASQSKKFKKIILIGSDIPSLTYDIIELTINFLDKNDYDKTEKYLKRAKDGIKGYVKGKIYQGFASGVKKFINKRGGKV